MPVCCHNGLVATQQRGGAWQAVSSHGEPAGAGGEAHNELVPAVALGAGDAARQQIGLHAPKVLRRGAYPAWGIYANVYMGEDASVVEYRVDGGAWQPMKQVSQPDPRLMVENVADDLADSLRGYDRSPEATASPHLWRGALPTDLAVGSHKVEVRSTQPDGAVFTASTSYSLQTAQP